MKKKTERERKKAARDRGRETLKKKTEKENRKREREKR